MSGRWAGVGRRRNRRPYLPALQEEREKDLSALGGTGFGLGARVFSYGDSMAYSTGTNFMASEQYLLWRYSPSEVSYSGLLERDRTHYSSFVCHIVAVLLTTIYALNERTC